MNVYLAGALFSQDEIERLHKVSKHLRDAGYDVYSPVEHKVDGADNMSNKNWAKAVYGEDIEAILRCDMVVALYDGLISDTGTAWEIGYAYGKGKCVLLVVDESVAEVNSLMVINGVTKTIYLSDLLKIKGPLDTFVICNEVNMEQK